MGRARLRHLDGLWGLAVLLVVAAHIAPGLLDAAGPLGVLLFFVLSSYLITTLLLEEHDATGRLDLPRFYLRRALRLMPALVVVLTLYLGVVMIVPGTQADHGGAIL